MKGRRTVADARGTRAWPVLLLLPALLAVGRDPAGRSARVEAGGLSAAPAQEGPADGGAVTVPAGTRVRLVLEDTVGTDRSRPGDPFSARVARPVSAGDGVAVPAGATVVGRVEAARRSGSARESALLRLSFRSLLSEGRELPFPAELVASDPVMRARVGTGERAAWIGGGAAAGGAAGWWLAGSSAAALSGAALGGVAVALYLMGTQDVDAVLPAGSAVEVQLRRPIRVPVG